MRKKNANNGRKSAVIGIRFFVIVLVLILISLSFKIATLIGKSRYTDKNYFTISVYNNKDFKILSFSENSSKISVINIDKGRTNIGNSDLNVKSFLAVPIDGEINTSLDIKKPSVVDLITAFILNYGSLKTDITIVDLGRLYLFAGRLPKTDISEKTISLSMESVKIDKIASKIFRDHFIEEENATIKIVNSTNFSGLGNRLGRLITNIGGNVVIIDTGRKEEKISTISYFGKKSYTVERMEKILGYKLNKLSERAITDIVIVIGTDSVLNPYLLE